MKSEWKTMRLGELASVQIGRTPSRTDASLWDKKRSSSNVWLSIADLNKTDRKIVHDSKEYISDKGAKGGVVIPAGTLLCSFKLTLGRLAYAGRNLYTNEAIAAITIKNDRVLLKEFLYWFLSFFDWQKAAEGDEKVKGKTFNKKKLQEIQICFPELVEQRRIVKLLDEAFTAIDIAKANTEKNLKNAREVFESHLNSVFTQRGEGWVKKPLGELCEGVEYGSSAKSAREGRVPVLRMGNIQDGRFDFRDLAYSNDELEIEKYLLSYNDVLFNRTNSPELVGKTAIFKGETQAIFAGYLIRIHRKADLLDADYLNYFLNSKIARDYGKTVMSSSVNQANINGAKLKSYPIPSPPLAEQQRIVSKIEDILSETRRLEGVYKTKLALVAELKKSLLHQAFSGNL